jgi:hypothetical protein
MRAALLAIVVIVLEISVTSVRAADDPNIERMATCRDSWLDWKKNDQDQLKKFGDHLGSILSQEESSGSFPTKTDTSIAGLHVTRIFPESVGMGVGFSVVVGAPFDTTRKTAERIFGKPLKKCDSSDNMRTCELEIGEKRTFMLMAEENAKTPATLLGCYYYYEK